MYGDKCKYIDVRNIINLQVYLLILAAEVLEGKMREKELVNVYIFQQPIALSKTFFKQFFIIEFVPAYSSGLRPALSCVPSLKKCLCVLISFTLMSEYRNTPY